MPFVSEWSDKMRKNTVIGIGRVIATDGQSPLKKSSSVGSSRIGFSLNLGTMINKKQDRTYETISCAVYSGFYGKMCYEIATTLKKNDVVLFGGWVHGGKYIDEVTGLEKESRECRIEFLLPLKYAYQMVFGVEENAKVDESDIPSKIVTHGNDEEYPI